MAEMINIGSSSSGNCFVVHDGNNTVVFDLGFKYDEFQKKYKRLTGKHIAGLGIDICFVTHRHKDHSRGIDSFLENCADIVAPKGLCGKWGTREVVPGHASDNGQYMFIPFELDHKDLAKNMSDGESKKYWENTVNIETYGYLVAFAETGNIWLYVTDTAYLPTQDQIKNNPEYNGLFIPSFFGVTHAIIECNHDLELVDNEAPELHIRRALESHLSVQDLVNILSNTDTTALRKLYLMHNSGANLDKRKAFKMIREIYKGEIIFCKKEGGFDAL